MSADGCEPDRLQTVLGRKKARGGQRKPDSVEVCPGGFRRLAWPRMIIYLGRRFPAPRATYPEVVTGRADP